MVKIKIQQLAPNTVLPTRQTKHAAGFDLCSTVNVTVPPMKPTLVPLGFAMELPEGYEAQIRPRSGLAFKHGITVLNTPGTIDADYRGEVCALLMNFSDKDFEIKARDRIAQMVINRLPEVELTLHVELSESERGSGGFGSTGQ
jgi:dUTP pyrophosphatase